MKQKEWITLGIGVAVIVIAALIAKPSLLGFSSREKEASTRQDGASIIDAINRTNTTTMGTQDIAQNGNMVSVHYTGKLANGTVFDSSYNRGEPITFQLGAGQVIKGWEEGILGMKVGEKKQLVIPPEKGYGAQAVGPIPPNSTLYFDVELVAVQ